MDTVDSAVCLRSRNGELQLQPWLEQMDDLGITHAVVAPAEEHVAVRNREGNEAIAAIVAKYPERLSGLAVASPWYGREAVDMLERAFDQGLCGLYLNPDLQGFHLSDHVVDPLIEVCARREMPVYAHTGTPVCGMPFQLAETARRFPHTPFVMGHAGWSDFWYDAVAAANQSPNIVIECSYYGSDMVRRFLDEVGADRVLFGSGYPWSLPRNELQKIRGMDLPPDVLAALMHDNACRTWRLEP